MTDGQLNALDSAEETAPGDVFGASASTSDGDGRGVEAADREQWTSWSNLWQVPTIVVSLALIGLGLFVASRRQPENDFDGAMDQVIELVESRDLEAARLRLTEVIEPHLDQATEAQRARFHAIQADWVDAFQRSAVARSADHDRLMAEEYAKAAALGLDLSPARLERWGMALVELGQIEDARRRLETLEGLCLAADADAPVRQRRNRLLRALIDRSLERGSESFASLMDVLERYRADDLIDLDDQLWAVARQAEVRLDAGRFTEAVDGLLIESRRLERRAQERGASLDFSEVHTLLGEGYYQLDRPDYATFQLERALELAPPSHPTRGRALRLLGDLAVAEDRLDDALSFYDDVVRNYVATDSELPARLGRAAILGVLGEHEASLSDFAAVRDELGTHGPCCGVDAERVTDVLMERVLAAIAADRLQPALDHLQIAESLYPANRVPGVVLQQLAAVHRQIASDLLASARPDPGRPAEEQLEQIDPATRADAAEHDRLAGESFVRHLRAVVGAPGGDDQWADSLWQAARSFDRAGDVDVAIRHYDEYLAGRPDDDPRVPEALLRRGQARHALGRLDEAIEDYERLVELHPRTNEAYGAYVPLAKARVANGQTAEARQLLVEVVEGRRGLSPEAPEYRGALIELGKILNELGSWVPAIERLTQAAERYPDDPRIHEVRFRLADCYRRRAAELADELADPTRHAVPDRPPLEAERRASLRSAMLLFAEVKAGLGAVDPRRLDFLERDELRWSFQYEADCAFGLGELEQAIGLYEQIVRQYPDEHAAMTALVQIVNCYTALGDVRRASEAHERAMKRLAQLPDSAFESGEAVLDREAWERWLANWPLGALHTKAGEDI